ncbi:zinc finger protein 831 [Megalops cyprinoides]|uniref:zinc finger protein 831 n=1 Tax=Megalops cyprinoides TaxID=118141 RepID=UPI001864FBE3|nr:zinc finger protein 831 [Megalops cyprinoides]
METGKQGFVSAPALSSSVSAQREDRMHDVQTPLPTVYLQTVGGLPLYPQTLPPASQDAVTLPLSISSLSSKQALPLLTFHIASGMHLQQQGQRSGTSSPAARPKSAGKHVCPHCGRDCLKPSVLKKHLRCHTGERPYPCTTCGVAFKTQSNLYKHKRTQAHARLSCESEKGSLSSQESVPCSGDSQSNSFSVGGQSEDSESFERDVGAPAVTLCTTSAPAQAPAPLGKIGSDTGWALHQAALVGLILAPVNENQEKLSSIARKTEPSSDLGTASVAKSKQTEQEEQRPAALTPNRHLPLQRQQATFSKQWESRKTRGKSQSHDSTDSGFSDSSDPHWTSSPGSTLHDHSMESLTESSMEHQEEPRPLEAPTDPGAASSGAKSRVSVLEKRKLEERISKLISENDALVDDKSLENVRPRKTVLSKQGSIDVPMPYTYKDSFHFEMRTSKQTNIVSNWQSPDRRVKQTMYNSVPTQRSTSFDHAPLTRSSSLPFSLGSVGFDKNGHPGHYQREGIGLGRRDSSGQLCPGEFVMRSVDQHASHHRSLVRQSAVDCQPATEGLLVTSSVEESYPSSLSSDGDSIDIVSDSSGGKCRRKKAQKFSYNKWYMYGGGTFTKLYNMEKGSDRGKPKKAMPCMEQEKVQGIPSRSTAALTEPSSSEVSTTSLRSVSDGLQTVCHPPCLPDHLPSSSSLLSAKEHSSQVSSEPCLQRPILKDLSGSTHHNLVRQSSLPAFDCTKGSRGEPVKEVQQEEQNTQRTPLLYVNSLPSERKKQRTENNMCMLVDNMQKQPLSSLCSGTTPKHSHTTERGDSGKLQVHHQDQRMDFSLCHLNQRSVQLKDRASLPSLVNVGRPSGSLTVSARPSTYSSTKSSFLPKYQLKLPHPADPGSDSEQSLSAPPITEESLAGALTLEQRLTATSVLASEQSHTAAFTPTSEQSRISTNKSAMTHCHSPTPNSSSEQGHTALSISTNRQTATPTPSSDLSCMSIPISGQTQAGSLMLTSEQRATFTPTSASELSHRATPTLGQTYTVSPTLTSEQRQTATSTPSSKQSDIAIPSSVCVNLNTNFPKGESNSEGKIILLKGVSHSTAEETDYVKTGDIQIFLQIISEEQLPLMEAPLSQQDSQLEANLCQDISQAAVRNAEVGIQNELQKLKTCHDRQLPAHTTQQSNSKNTIHSSAGFMAPNTEAPGTVSYPGQCEQNLEKCAQKSSTHSNPIAGYAQACSILPAPTDIVEHSTEGSVLRPGQSQLDHADLQIHKQSDYGDPSSAKNSQSPNEEQSEHILCLSQDACPQDRVTQQQIRAETADSVALVHNQAPLPSSTSPTVIIEAGSPPSTSPIVMTEKSTYICPHTPGNRSGVTSRSALAEAHRNTKRQTLSGSDEMSSSAMPFPSTSAVGQELQALPPEVSLLVQNKAVITATVPPQLKHCNDCSSSQSQILSVHQLEPSSLPQSSHLQDVPRCPDGILPLSMHHQSTAPSPAPCRTEGITAAEWEGGGDSSSVSYFPSTSNHLFSRPCPRTPAPPPAAISQLNTQIYTREESSLGQDSQSQSSREKQDTVDSVKTSFNQTESSTLGQVSLLTDMGQQAKHAAVSLQKHHPRLQKEIQRSPLSVTQELAQQTTSEHAALVSTPLTDTEAQQNKAERRAQEVPAHRGSSWASLTAPRVSQQELVPASLPGQHKLCLAAGISLSPIATAEISSGSVLLHVSVQHKPLNQRVPCSAGKQRTKCGIHENEATVNPIGTSGGLRPGWPASSVQGCNISETIPASVRQHSKASPPSHSHICSSLSGRGPLLQDPAACVSASALMLPAEKPEITQKTSNALCEPSSRPLGRLPSGRAVSSLTRSQVQSGSDESQGQASTPQGQSAPQGVTAADQGEFFFEEKPGDEVLFCTPADIKEKSQDPTTGHQQTLSVSGSEVKKENETQGTRWRPERWESRAVEEGACKGTEVPERRGMEETERRGMEKQERGNSCTSPLMVPTKEATKGDDLKERLAGETHSYSSSGLLLHTAQSPTKSETSALHTLQVHAQSKTSASHTLQVKAQSDTSTLHTLQVNVQSETSTLQTPQPPTQSKTSILHTVNIHTVSETSTLHTLQIHAQSETSSLHTPQPPTQSETSSLQTLQAPANRESRLHGIHQGQLSGHQDSTSCSREWGIHRPLLPQPYVHKSPTPESCPLSMNAAPLTSGVGAVTQAVSCGMRDSAAHPFQPRTLSALGSRLHREGLRGTTHTSSRNADCRPSQTVTCSIPARSEQPSALHTLSSATYTHPFLSHTSTTHCSLSLSVKSSEAPVRAGQSSLEEADTSSSDDEGRLVIEL